MKYSLNTPCEQCPFLKGMRFSYRRLTEFASGEFPCHKACDVDEESGDFIEKDNGKTPHCAGALIFNEKREQPHQMMRICERLGKYDRRKLDMAAPVVERPEDCLLEEDE